MKKQINSLSVFEFGKKENPSIIFVHGFPFDHTMWGNQIKELQKEYHVIVYDIRGFGDSYVGDGQYTMEAYVSDLLSVVNEMNLNKPTLCGLSMGGYIALRAVEVAQEKFGSLILLDTKSQGDDDKGRLVRSININKINVDGLETFVEGFVSNVFAEESKTELKSVYTKTLKTSKSHNPLGVKGALFAMISRTDTTKSLKKIRIPTLVMGGAFDKLTPPSQLREMADKIKNSEFAVVPRAGHMSPLENPNFVNDMIRGFLKRNNS